MDEKELAKSLEVFAHKIKNPIHSAVINLDVLKVKLQKQAKDPTTLRHLDVVSSEVSRISDIIGRYLKYVQLNDKDRSKVDLKKLLR